MNEKLVQNPIQIRERSPDRGGNDLIVRPDLTLQTLYQHEDCPEILRSTLRKWTVWQKREEYSFKRTILSPNLAPQTVAALIALDAVVEFPADQSPPSSLAEYLLRSTPNRGELLALSIPVRVPGRVWGEAHVSLTATQAPIVYAVAVLDLKNEQITRASLALTGVWRESARLAESASLLIGKALSESQINTCLKQLKAEISPPQDSLGSSEYRREMAAVVTRRALELCKNGASQS
jgi:CO/xanthine dehydrogenase FAD-binding subunit